MEVSGEGLDMLINHTGDTPVSESLTNFSSWEVGERNDDWPNFKHLSNWAGKWECYALLF